MRAWRLIALGFSLTVACGQAGLQAKESKQPRRIHYSFDKGDAFVIVTVQETAAGAHGDVVFTRGSKSSSPSYRGSFQLSHNEFEQIWSTLDAPGVAKRAVNLTASGIDLSDDYAFRTADGHYYYVAKASGAAAVSALSFRLRALADKAMATVKQIPPTTVTAVEVIDHGIYQVDPPTQKEKAPKTTSGTWNVTQTAKLLKKTDSVPARLGTSFGVRYRLKGQPEGELVRIRAQAITRLRSTDGTTKSRPTRQEYEVNVAIGKLDYRGIVLDDPSDLVGGEYTLRLLVGSKLLFEQVFQVLPQK